MRGAGPGQGSCWLQGVVGRWVPLEGPVGRAGNSGLLRPCELTGEVSGLAASLSLCLQDPGGIPTPLVATRKTLDPAISLERLG